MTDAAPALATKPIIFDGKPAKMVLLRNNSGITVSFMDIGATWLTCQLLRRNREVREVLLGVSTVKDAAKQTSYLGNTVGRYANRIANGQFQIEGEKYQVSTNQAGNCLHGGKYGLDKRRWNIKTQCKQSVTFSISSEDGDQGFPGNLEIEVTYTLSDDNEIRIEYKATTDKATPVNLTNHAYFNLSGAESGKDCLSHSLAIDAEYFLPTDRMGIPIGALQSVADTSFDFRRRKVIETDFLSDEQQKLAHGYDHSFLFNQDRDVSKPIALVRAADDSVTMTVTTDKPAMQLYTGNWLKGTPNRKGLEYANYAGLALETQFLPDSPNHPEWPQQSCILQPGQVYQFFTSYKFTF